MYQKLKNQIYFKGVKVADTLSLKCLLSKEKELYRKKEKGSVLSWQGATGTSI